MLVQFQNLRDDQSRLLDQLAAKEGEVGAALDQMRQKNRVIDPGPADAAELKRRATYRKYKETTHKTAVDMRQLRVEKYIIKHEAKAREETTKLAARHERAEYEEMMNKANDVTQQRISETRSTLSRKKGAVTQFEQMLPVMRKEYERLKTSLLIDGQIAEIKAKVLERKLRKLQTQHQTEVQREADLNSDLQDEIGGLWRPRVEGHTLLINTRRLAIQEEAGHRSKEATHKLSDHFEKVGGVVCAGCCSG